MRWCGNPCSTFTGNEIQSVAEQIIWDVRLEVPRVGIELDATAQRRKIGKVLTPRHGTTRVHARGCRSVEKDIEDLALRDQRRVVRTELIDLRRR